MQTRSHQASFTALKTLLAASTLATAGLAQAAYSTIFTLEAGGPEASAFGWTVAPLKKGAVTLSFSNIAIGVVALTGAETTIEPPATGIVDMMTSPEIVMQAPIGSLSAAMLATDLRDSGGTMGIIPYGVATAGGITLTNTRTNFGTSGGYLSISDIQVDLSSHGIYATLSGGNGLSTQTVRVWDYESERSTSFYFTEFGQYPVGSFTMDYQLSGLTLTSEAFDLFVQGLGYRAPGVAALRSVRDFGVMTISIPEPSTYALAGTGLLIAGFAAKRRRAAAA